MPLHVDVTLNDDKKLDRVNIARMTRNGLSKDSVNEYAVVVSEIRRVYDQDWPYSKEEFTSPSEADYDASVIRFEHRYGDDSIICVMKALQALRPETLIPDELSFNITNSDESVKSTDKLGEDKIFSQAEYDAMEKAIIKTRSGGTQILAQMIYNLEDKNTIINNDKLQLLKELSESEKIREAQKDEIKKLQDKIKASNIPHGKIHGARSDF